MEYYLKGSGHDREIIPLPPDHPPATTIFKHTELSNSTMNPLRTPRITIAGAATSTLRSINRCWKLLNAANAIPYNMHPQGEHRANRWHPSFQTALEKVAKITLPTELAEIKARMRFTVYARCHGKPRRANYVTIADLASVLRQMRNKRAKGGAALMEARSMVPGETSGNTSVSTGSGEATRKHVIVPSAHGSEVRFRLFGLTVRFARAPGESCERSGPS